jgi:hypothetical protein
MHLQFGNGVRHCYPPVKQTREKKQVCLILIGYSVLIYDLLDQKPLIVD